MKGIYGIVIAVFLGLFAMALNWLYLNRAASGLEMVSFVAIKTDTTILPGELIKESHLEEVTMPEKNAEGLLRRAYRWPNDKQTVAGIRASQKYEGGELVLAEHYKTPSPEIDWQNDQELIWVTLDTRAIQPALVDPGDLISFIVSSQKASPQPKSLTPTDASGIEPRPAKKKKDAYTDFEKIGPFRIAALGNRRGSADVMKSKRISQVQPNQVAVFLKTDNSGKYLGDSQRLVQMVRTNTRNIGITLHRPVKK
jgi:hypothetical protein